MDRDQLAFHATGLELQIIELVEQRKRAEVQGEPDEAGRLDREIDTLHAELAELMEDASL